MLFHHFSILFVALSLTNAVLALPLAGSRDVVVLVKDDLTTHAVDDHDSDNTWADTERPSSSNTLSTAHSHRLLARAGPGQVSGSGRQLGSQPLPSYETARMVNGG